MKGPLLTVALPCIPGCEYIEIIRLIIWICPATKQPPALSLKRNRCSKTPRYEFLIQSIIKRDIIRISISMVFSFSVETTPSGPRLLSWLFLTKKEKKKLLHAMDSSLFAHVVYDEGE